jgi:bile acid:Na+ symporter, BASS family
LLVLATLMHNVAGYFLGYWAGRLLKFSERDCRTISLEVGMQNAGLASGLALTMGKIATIGLAPAIFGPMMNTTGCSLASWWHNHDPDQGGSPLPPDRSGKATPVDRGERPAAANGAN